MLAINFLDQAVQTKKLVNCREGIKILLFNNLRLHLIEEKMNLIHINSMMSSNNITTNLLQMCKTLMNLKNLNS